MKRILFIFSLALVALVAACQQGPSTTPTPTPGASKPSVIIVSPASNSTVQSGAAVTVQSTSTDTEGVVLVELIVDRATIQNSPTPNGQPQQQFSVIQTWTATTPGTHTITVRATNSRLGTGEASITVNVEQQIAQATATLVINPTPVISTATAVAPSVTPVVPPTPRQPTPSGPSTCTLASTFINDITIPDGTVIAPGGSFVKTWAIRNSGTCSWGGGYNAVFVGGLPMGASSPQPIPAAGPGDTINISINFIAPTTPGNYSSVWQIQASNGVLFGTRFDAVIVVPGAPTARPPTAVPPTARPPLGCNGTPVFSSFTANPQTINPGQITTLNWGAVSNASAVYLTSPSGTQGVGTPGGVQVQPGQTTTYTLTAYCNNVPAQLQVTVNVTGGGVGCNGTPVFNGFFANPQTINVGQTTTLNWGLVQNASAVYLQLPDRTEGVASPASRQVRPGVTTTYKLIAYCGNNQASISTTVNVNGGCSGSPQFNGFTANPGTINKGQTSVLSWGVVTNATSVILETPNGNSGVGTPGQITVQPQSTTKYRLIAYCNNTQNSIGVTVTVNQPQPSPTPPPPTQQPNTQVRSIRLEQSGNQEYRLSINYYWNGQNSPARMQAIGINKDGLTVTNQPTADVAPGAFRSSVLKIKVHGNRTVVKFQACIVGRNGNELACNQVNVP